MELEQVVDTVDVPRNTGTEGFLQLIRYILKLGRVQDIHVTGSGRVTYKYLVPKDRARDPFSPETLFENVSPAYVIRNCHLIEVRVQDGDNSAEVLLKMLRMARLDGAKPVAWATGADSLLPRWLMQRSGLPEGFELPGDVLCGFPLYQDRMLPDESLTLCASARASDELVDTTHAYKIAMVLP